MRGDRRGRHVETAHRKPEAFPDRAVSINGAPSREQPLFRNRYRIQSARLRGWDYASSGYYFVTMCTKARQPFLGNIVVGAMTLSTAGEIVSSEWRGIEWRRRDVVLDEWVVMPNHVHGIIVLTDKAPVEPHAVETPQRKRDGIPPSVEQDITGGGPDEPIQRGVSTTSASETAQRQPNDARLVDVSSGKQMAPTMPRLAAGSVGAIIGQFKSRCTKRIWASGRRDFGWQPRFYDHIIRNDQSLAEIRQYIIDNPLNWDPIEDIPDNLWM